ncbi:MAG: DUF4065 domain-containing protein [Clostridiales bacterium]|nr:DUF4065 domain-containing protein [Clostridiales bacterium]
MDRIFDVAEYIFKKYKSVSKENIDGMKLYKLLYFAQRECLAITGSPMFEEKLLGWKYGPVSADVRHNLTSDGVTGEDVEKVSDASKYILNNVILEYGALSSWKLSELSHKEISWKNARTGLNESDIGTKPLLLDDIRKDSEKVRPYDHIWDMYYDEFEDSDEEIHL